MNDKIKFVTIATVGNATHAALLKNVLEVESIQAIVTDGFIGDTLWMYQVATGGIKVQVKQQDAEQARAVLENKEPLSMNDDQWMEHIPQENKMEDEYVENETEMMIHRSYKAALIGLAFIPIQLYSIWLLYKIASLTDEDPHPKYKNKMLTSVMFNFTVFMMYGILFLSLFDHFPENLDVGIYLLFFLPFIRLVVP